MRVLYVTYGGGHVAMILPVMAALRAQASDIKQDLMALTIGRAKAEAAGEAPFGYAEMLDLVDSEQALRWGRTLAPTSGNPSISERENHAYHGINYLDLIEEFGEAGAADHYARKGRGGFAPRAFFRRVIAHLKPDLVVTTNSPRSEVAALSAATDLGVPNLALVDLFDRQPEPFMTRPHKPDAVCVIANTVAERLISGGQPPDTIHNTGNPAFDTLFDPATREAADDFLKQKGWQGLRPILFAGVSEHRAPNGEAQKIPLEAEALLRAHVDANPDLALILRYHPSDWHLFPTGHAHPRIHVSPPPDEPLHPLLWAASAVLVQNSTVGLEAAMIGKPSISLEYSHHPKATFSLAELGVTRPCHDPQTLCATIDEALNARGTDQMTAYRGDGRAAERVAALIRMTVS